MITCDGEDCGGVAEGDEPVSSTAVIDDQLHVVGTQWDVVCSNGEGGGWSICHLPVTPWNTKIKQGWTRANLEDYWSISLTETTRKKEVDRKLCYSSLYNCFVCFSFKLSVFIRSTERWKNLLCFHIEHVPVFWFSRAVWTLKAKDLDKDKFVWQPSFSQYFTEDSRKVQPLV